ncbi:MAG: LuxR C-terminal-related transcriptional regulator [Syntrophomonadaceae bacterium]
MLTDYQLHKYNSIVQTVYASSDINELRINVLCGLQKLIPCHSAAFFIVDSHTLEFSEPLLHGIEASSFNDYNQYYQDFDLYKQVVFSRKDVPITDRCSDYINYKDWENNEHRVDFLLPQGIYHMACMQIFNDGQICGEISLHRNKQQQDFSNDEMLLIKLLQEHVNARFAALLMLRDSYQIFDKSIQGMALLLVDRHGQLQGATGNALELLPQSLNSGQNVFRHIKEKCFRLYQENDNPDNTAGSRIYRGRLELSCGTCRYQIFLLRDESLLKNIRFLVVINNHCLQNNLKEYSLTSREAQIASLITRGKTNKQIARDLGVSENTVKTFIKRLFNKMDVHSRSQLISEMYKLGK